MRLGTVVGTAFIVPVFMVPVFAVAACSAAPAEIGTPRTPEIGAPRTPPPAASAPPSVAAAPRTLVRDLEVPWAIAFLPGGDALVTERDSSRLLKVTASGQVTEVGTIDGAVQSGEGGLLGVAVSPKDPSQVFVYFTSDSDNRIVRYHYDGRLSDPKVLVQGIPSGGIHNGGRLEFGPDGYLYAATGETGQRGLAQDRDSLGGKILRMTTDGAPAPGNPFGTLVYSYGHRNVQGLAWDEQGRMYATEFGQNTYDEVNRIEAGKNYGWPEVEGDGGSDDGFVDPLLTWSTDEASPSGLAYANGSLWAAALRGERLWRIPLNDDGTAGRPISLYEGEFGRLRAVETAPDGTLWVTTSNHDGRGDPRRGDDRILVIEPR